MDKRNNRPHAAPDRIRDLRRELARMSKMMWISLGLAVLSVTVSAVFILFCLTYGR